MGNQIFGWIDEKLFSILKLDLEASIRYVDHRSKADENGHGVLHDMDVIDTKSSALLAHITLMLAVVALLFDSESPLNKLLIVEFVLYTGLATALLRCIDILGPPYRTIQFENEENAIQYWHREALIRRSICQLVQRGTIFLTAILGLTILIRVF